MQEFALRLKEGQALKETVSAYLKEEKIDTAVVIAAVGSFKALKLRLAGAQMTKEFKEDLELIALNGTFSVNGAHLHLAVADAKGQVYGGHLSEAWVNTTVELVMLSLNEYHSKRVYDPQTGYKEIEFERI